MYTLLARSGCFGKHCPQRFPQLTIILIHPKSAGLWKSDFGSKAFPHINALWYIALFVYCNKAASVGGIAYFCFPFCGKRCSLASSRFSELLVLSYIRTTNLCMTGMKCIKMNGLYRIHHHCKGICLLIVSRPCIPCWLLTPSMKCRDRVTVGEGVEQRQYWWFFRTKCLCDTMSPYVSEIFARTKRDPDFRCIIVSDSKNYHIGVHNSKQDSIIPRFSCIREVENNSGVSFFVWARREICLLEFLIAQNFISECRNYLFICVRQFKDALGKEFKQFCFIFNNS